MASYPLQLDLTTFSARLLDRLVVFVCRPGLDIADTDWRAYVDWLKLIQADKPQPFRAHELDKALAFFGESNAAAVRTAIREMGGVVYNAAP